MDSERFATLPQQMTEAELEPDNYLHMELAN